MTSPRATAARPLRADAARNLERVVGAATELFAEQGLDVRVEDIATRAGVGMGTLYRRFPNKDALIAFLVDELVTSTLELGNRPLAEPGDAGLEAFLVGRAHAAGSLRPEITTTDVSVLLWSLQQIVTMTANVAPNAWRRHLEILLAGISNRPRAITHRPLSQRELTIAIDGLNANPAGS